MLTPIAGTEGDFDVWATKILSTLKGDTPNGKIVANGIKMKVSCTKILPFFFLLMHDFILEYLAYHMNLTEVILDLLRCFGRFSIHSAHFVLKT